ncbi:ABC transporter permease subunit [Pseudoneobacillus sp. C159]
MNIFFYELNAYRKSTMIWTVSLCVLVAFFLSIYPSFSQDAAEFKKLLEGYPEVVRKALGVRMDSIFTLMGFYSYIFIYISLCGAIQAMNFGTSIVSKEIREKTADFLLTKPVTRTTIITAKLGAAFFSLLFTNLVYLVVSYLVTKQVTNEAFSSKTFLLISLTLFFIQLMFLSLGFMIAVLYRKLKSVLTISLGTVFTFFIIAMISSATGDDAKRFLSPFKYFEHRYIIEHGSYETSFLLTSAGFILVAILGSYYIYKNKDVHTV